MQRFKGLFLKQGGGDPYAQPNPAAADSPSSSETPSVDPDKQAASSDPFAAALLGEPFFDVEADRQKRKKQALLCYGSAAIVVSLLLTLIFVCVGLPIARFGKDGSGATRTYYIQAEYVNWTFVPNELNNCYIEIAPGVGGPGPSSTGDNTTVAGTFKKAKFTLYTDKNFDTPVPVDPKWEHLGIVGPTLYAEAGDTVDIFFKNHADFPMNLEPAGLEWNVPGLLKPVSPGRIVVFTWIIPEEAAPAKDDPQNSRAYLYRSTISPPRHENAGLSGLLIVTRKGEARPDGSSKDVDRDIVTIFEVYNENETPAAGVPGMIVVQGGFNGNVNNPAINETELFRKVVNGYSWCRVPGLTMNVGERVRWHIAAMGSEEGLHNFHWHGNVLTRQGVLADQFQAVPGSTLSADMILDNPGTWMFHCHVNEHLDGGMVALYTVNGPAPGQPPVLIQKPQEEIITELGGRVRRYYVAANEVDWDYTPLGGNACSPAFDEAPAGVVEPFEEGHPLATPGNGSLSLGRKVLKSQFQEYTDETFTTLKPRPASDAYLGLVGPIFKGEVGDTIIVRLRNNARFPVTLHPHGVLYKKAGEGAPYNDNTSGDDRRDDGVPQGQEWDYVWHVPERAGPGPKDPSSVLWMYHSHTDESSDTFAGLFGGIIIYRKGESSVANVDDLVAADVDREVVIFFSNMEESVSRYAADNAQSLLAAEAAARGLSLDDLLEDEDFVAANQRPSVNGYSYCNMPGLKVKAGERVRFHFMALGAQLDMHAPSVDGGSTYMPSVGHFSSKVQLSPGTMKTMDMETQRQGLWRIMCGVQEHTDSGLMATYEVTPGVDPLPQLPADIPERVWYVAAEDLVWDYAPGYNGSVPMCTQVDFSPGAEIFLKPQDGMSIGHVNAKAHYVLYTDETFTEKVPQPAWHGIQGPLLAAEVGEKLTVVLKNMMAVSAVNLRPLAPLLAIGTDGSQEAAQGSARFAPSIEPGQTVTYRWYVPEEAGPGPNDVHNTQAYTYASSVEATAQENLGLVGGLVIGCKGCMNWSKDRYHPVPVGVDRLEPMLWQVYDENLSPYLQANMATAGVKPEMDLGDPDFMESNMKHSVNGYMYCTGPWVELTEGETVRWVNVDFGGATALHSPFFQGHVLHTATGPASTDIMFPGQAVIYDMLADRPGTWPMYCQVHDHSEAGMMGTFRISPGPNGPLPLKKTGDGLHGRRMLQ